VTLQFCYLPQWWPMCPYPRGSVSGFHILLHLFIFIGGRWYWIWIEALCLLARHGTIQPHNQIILLQLFFPYGLMFLPRLASNYDLPSPPSKYLRLEVWPNVPSLCLSVRFSPYMHMCVCKYTYIHAVHWWSLNSRPQDC
jgi:hypothetical protein